MTVRVFDYRGDATYFVADHAMELDGLRVGPAWRPLAPASDLDSLAAALSCARRCDAVGARDVVIAAPKEVSVLLAVGGEAVAGRVVALHSRCVDDAWTYLDDEALGGRGGAGARTVVGFTHGINRLGDPHLHTHVVVAGHRDGAPANDGLALRRHAGAADGLYLAGLRAGLPDAAGLVAWMTPTGAVRVEGVDAGLVASTSAPRGRDGRIERTGRKTHPSALDARARWAAQIDRAPRFEPPAPPTRDRDVIDEHRLAVVLGDGLVARRDLVRAWASACPFGAWSAEVRGAVARVGDRLDERRQVPAVQLRAGAAASVLGPRPIELSALDRWLAARAAVDRFVHAGHDICHLREPRGASAATLLAIARLDVTLRDMGAPRSRAPERGRAVGAGRAIS